MEEGSNNSWNGNESDKHTPPYIVGSSAESVGSNGNIISAADSTPLMAESKPKQICFRKSTMLDSAKIIHEVVIPSYFQFIREFKWIYSSTTSRYHAIASQYTRIIEAVINQPPQYNYSHVLYDKNNFTNIVGHILLAPPHPTNGSLIPNKYEMMRDIYWKQALNHGIMAMWKNYKLYKAIDFMHHELTKYCHRYWSAEIIAIKPIWQSNGFGTFMLNKSHNYIKDKMSLNKMDKKVPVVLWTLTENNVKFYLKNGYQTFITINIDETEKVILYGMLYHSNNDTKHQWMSILKDNLKYKIRLNLFQHILPKTCCGWIQLIISLPLLCFYLFLCSVLRFFACEKK